MPEAVTPGGRLTESEGVREEEGLRGPPWPTGHPAPVQLSRVVRPRPVATAHRGCETCRGCGWEPHGGPGAHRKGFGLRRCTRRLQAGPSRTPRHPATARPSQTLRTGLCHQTQASESEKLSRGRAGDPECSGGGWSSPGGDSDVFGTLGAAGRFPGPRVFRRQTLELESCARALGLYPKVRNPPLRHLLSGHRPYGRMYFRRQHFCEAPSQRGHQGRP